MNEEADPPYVPPGGADGLLEVRDVPADSNRRIRVAEATVGLLQWLVENEDFPTVEVPKLRDESVRVLSACASPHEASARRTGLVCGFVQSGKTASIETVSALARDNGFRLLILLAGVTKILVEQSRQRVEHLRGGGGYDWVLLNNPHPRRERPELENLVRGWRTLRAGEAGGRTLFVTVMKQRNHLANLTALLEGLRLDRMPALIFDDEADQASLNTRPLDPRPSPIYLAIRGLRNVLPHHTLLQYTATPQAPLLISRIDSLSADFAEVISPGAQYTGGQVFFREHIADLVRQIPEEEFVDEEHLPEPPPATLRDALAVFFVGVASEYAIRRPTGHRSMLVHPHYTRVVHETFLGWVQRIQRDWCEVLENPNEPDRPDVLRVLEAAHADLARTTPDLPAWGRIQPHLLEGIRNSVPRLVNSNDGREIQWDNHYAHILVGGEKLGRGYTIRGLTVTYMPRGPGSWNADTIQQRARFFGYHAEYLGLCRLYLHPDVIEVYEAYLDHEMDVRTKIAEHRGQPLQNLKRAFILDADLRPTRHNVLSRLYQRPLRAEWYEQRWPHATPAGIVQNQGLVTAFRGTVPFRPHAEYGQHSFADCDLDSLLRNFLSRIAVADDRDEMSFYAIVAALGGYARTDPGASARVFFMSDGQTRYRQQSERDRGVDLLQGPSSAGADRYPGDRRFFRDEQTTIQIHMLDIGTGPRRTGTFLVGSVPTLAIRLPTDLRDRLNDVIVQAAN